MSSPPAWKKATQKQESTVYLEEDEDDVAALFFGAGGGPQSVSNDASADDEEEDVDAAAAYFAEQEEKTKNGVQDDDSSSSSSSDSGGGSDDGSTNSEQSGSASDNSSRSDNDDSSRSSQSNSNSNDDGRSRGSSSGSESDEVDAAAAYFAEQEEKAKRDNERDDGSQQSDSSRSSRSEEEVELSEDDDRSRSDGSGRSERSGSGRSSGSDGSRSHSSGSQSNSDDRSQSSRSHSSDSASVRDERGDYSSDDVSRSTRSSSSGRSSRSTSSRSDSDSGSHSKASHDGASQSDDSSRSSRSANENEASGDDESARGSEASSYEEVEVSSDNGGRDTDNGSTAKNKSNEKKENAKRAWEVPASAQPSVPKPVNTYPVKSFLSSSSTIPANKVPDVKAKPAFVKSDDGLAPWQTELKKRKETGEKLPGWKKPKKEESTIYVEDDEEDIAALFFEVGGGKPKSAKFSIGGGSGSDENDAAAMFQSTGQTEPATGSSNDEQTRTGVGNTYSDNDEAAMLQAAERKESAAERSNGDDAAAMYNTTEHDPQDNITNQVENETGEYFIPKTDGKEIEPLPVSSGDEKFAEVVEEHDPSIDEELPEEVEEVQRMGGIEEEVVLEEDDGAYVDEEMIIEVEEEYIDEETVATSNEHDVAAGKAAQERRIAQQRAYQEMERIELEMRHYIATLAHGESARSVHSDQSSVPWAIAPNGDYDPTASYASYIQSARERRMDDQSSYFKPDMEIPTGDSIAETETDASSEQRSIPWGLEIRETDSWLNPVRRLENARKSEAKENITTNNKESSTTLTKPSQSAVTFSSMSKKTPNKRKRRAPSGFGEMISAEVYKTSLPDPERETELWYHPGFAYLSQNATTKPYYFPPPPKMSQSNSWNDSEGTDKAVVSDLEAAQQMYNSSVPSISKVTLLSYGEKTISQWNMLQNTRRRNDQSSSSSSSGSSELRLPDLSKTIMRTASPWTANSKDSDSSSGSMSYDLLVPFEDEGSDGDKRRNVVFSRSGSSVSIDLEVETFEYVPESSLSLRPESESTLETESAKSTRGRLPCGIYGFMALCFILVLVPTSVAIYFLMIRRSGEAGPAPVNPNFIFPTRAPTIAPILANKTIDEASDVPSSAPIPPDVPMIPTLQPTGFDPLLDEPVTEDLLFRLLASASVDNGAALRNRRSPQFAAMEWLRTPSGFSGVSNDNVFLQRYALATFYYSTSGDSWTENDLWLSAANACDWFSSGGSLLCNSDGAVTALTLTNNGLKGNLPNEIGILSQLETIMLSGNNELNGPVPRSLQLLSNLRSIFIEGTGLSMLPPEVCDLRLQDFWANCDELGCTCCNECFF